MRRDGGRASPGRRPESWKTSARKSSSNSPVTGGPIVGRTFAETFLQLLLPQPPGEPASWKQSARKRSSNSCCLSRRWFGGISLPRLFQGSSNRKCGGEAPRVHVFRLFLFGMVFGCNKNQRTANKSDYLLRVYPFNPPSSSIKGSPQANPKQTSGFGNAVVRLQECMFFGCFFSTWFSVAIKTKGQPINLIIG